MKKIGVLIFAGALVIGLFAATMSSFGRVNGDLFSFPFNFGKVRGSGKSAIDVREVSDFHGVDVSGVFQVEIVAQKDFSVEIEADDNLLPYITTKVRNGVLHIGTEKRLSTSNPLRVRINAPDIDKIESSGATAVLVSGLKNSGLSVDSSGASKLSVAGETAKLMVDVSGATKIDAEGLTAQNATVEASGASSVTVNVTGNLRVDLSGASKVAYVGTPDIVKKTSGASSVVQK